MRPYLSYFKLIFLRGFQYKAAAIAGIGTQFFFGLIYIMIFKAFYDATSITPSIPYEQLTTYIWIGQMFFAMLFIALKDGEIFEMIKNGNVAYELCRPINLYYFWLVKGIARRVGGALIRFLPTFLVAVFIMPHPYNLGAPASFLYFILFFITISLGVIIMCSIANMIHISTFFTLNQMGLVSIMFTVADFFSGALIPIPFFPKVIQYISYILPFRLTYDLPLRTYIGNIEVFEVLMSIGLQIVWIGVLLYIGNKMMKKITNKVVIQGG